MVHVKIVGGSWLSEKLGIKFRPEVSKHGLVTSPNLRTGTISRKALQEMDKNVMKGLQKVDRARSKPNSKTSLINASHESSEAVHVGSIEWCAVLKKESEDIHTIEIELLKSGGGYVTCVKKTNSKNEIHVDKDVVCGPREGKTEFQRRFKKYTGLRWKDRNEDSIAGKYTYIGNI